jgi:hypothetical protein
MPESRTETSTPSAEEFLALICSSQARSFTEAIASRALIMRFRITCSSWTRSPRIIGSLSEISSLTAIWFLSKSHCSRAIVSRMISPILSAVAPLLSFFTNSRTRRITELARLPSRTISIREFFASSTSGVLPSSQRRPASAFVTTPARG